MCAGIAGEAEEARPSSWTERSNICEEAGDGIPGDGELRLREGDAGAPYGCEIVCVIGAPTPVIGDTERMLVGGAVVAVVGGILVEAVALVFLLLSSSFFLPKPQNLRFPIFPSSSGALFNPSPKSGTDDVRDPVSSPASLLKLIRLSAIVPGGRKGLLGLHGWARSDSPRQDLIESQFTPWSHCKCAGKERTRKYLKKRKSAWRDLAKAYLSALVVVCGLMAFSRTLAKQVRFRDPAAKLPEAVKAKRRKLLPEVIKKGVLLILNCVLFQRLATSQPNGDAVGRDLQPR